MTVVNLAVIQTIKCAKAAYLTVELGRALGVELEPTFFIQTDIRKCYQDATNAETSESVLVNSSSVPHIINESLDFFESVVLSNLHNLLGGDLKNEKDPESSLMCARNVISRWCLRTSTYQTSTIGFIKDLDSIYALDTDLRNDYDANSPCLHNLTNTLKQSLDTLEILNEQLIRILHTLYAGDHAFTSDEAIMESAFQMFCMETAMPAAQVNITAAQVNITEATVSEKQIKAKVMRQRPTKANEI